jgi:hypothetical protein
MSTRYLIVPFLLISTFCSFSQSKSGYYLFPINPGQQNFLAGSMGELRTSHFHAGIDIKTGGQMGLPVHAAADGYVSRIKVSGTGYGNALYIQHPNGTSTVYAHLNKYEKLIARYVVENQYKDKTFEIDLFPLRDKLPVKKGDIIGYSGNSGSSSGPHLHFEIRDRNQMILDPLSFGFAEIKDQLPPVLKRIAFVTLEENARVNHTFGWYDFEVLQTTQNFTTRVPIHLEGKVGIEIYGYDRQDGVYSHNGISQTILKIDGDTIFSENKTLLDFNKQRDILTHIDFAAFHEKGIKYNKLFVDDGNTLKFYGKGSKTFTFDDKEHLIQIYMIDGYGNLSTFETTINNHKIVNKPDPNIYKYEIFRNFIHLKAPHTGAPNLIELYLANAHIDIAPYRVDKATSYYLWDLRKGLPDSINYCGEMIKTGIYSEIPSATETGFYNHHIDVLFSKNDLFDTLYLQFQKSYDQSRNYELFKFPHQEIPLRSAVEVRLKPAENYDQEYTRVYSLSGSRLNYIGGTWHENTIKFKARELQNFTLAVDKIPPTITPATINTKEVYFKISDNLSGINKFEATINGQFVLMNYEPKKNLIWSEKLEPNIPFVGEFVLKVVDNLGNTAFYKKTF